MLLFALTIHRCHLRWSVLPLASVSAENRGRIFFFHTRALWFLFFCTKRPIKWTLHWLKLLPVSRDGVCWALVPVSATVVMMMVMMTTYQLLSTFFYLAWMCCCPSHWFAYPTYLFLEPRTWAALLTAVGVVALSMWSHFLNHTEKYTFTHTHIYIYIVPSVLFAWGGCLPFVSGLWA